MPEVAEDLKEELIPIAQNAGGKLQFGKYLVDHHKLKGQGIFSVSHPNGKKVAGIKNLKVSRGLQNALVGLVEKGKVTGRGLGPEEHGFLHRVIKKAGIGAQNVPTNPSTHNTAAGNVSDHTRLNTLMGEIEAGNDNDELKQQLSGLVHKMHGRGLITTDHARSIAKEFL